MTAAEDAPDVAGLECTGKLKLDYATGFDVYYYENDYALIDVHDSAQYLLVPDGQEAPDGPGIGCDRAAEAAEQDLSGGKLCDGTLPGAGFAGLYQDDRYRRFRMVHPGGKGCDRGRRDAVCGKIQRADYEMLVDEDCDVAIESTMILHTPKVQEMIENLGIPVFIDRSSYEMHPLAVPSGSSSTVNDGKGSRGCGLF